MPLLGPEIRRAVQNKSVYWRGDEGIVHAIQMGQDKYWVKQWYAAHEQSREGMATIFSPSMQKLQNLFRKASDGHELLRAMRTITEQLPNIV